MTKRLIFIITVLMIIFPVLNVYAGGTGIWKDTQCAANSEHGGPTEPCNFCDALIVANNIIGELMKYALVIAGVMIVVGAVIIMVSSGSSKLISRGRNTITKAITGAAVSLLAYLIVGTFIHVLSGEPNFPWDTISCNNPIYESQQIAGNQANAGLYAKIDADGIWHCASTCDSIKGVNSQTQCYTATSSIDGFPIQCGAKAQFSEEHTFGVKTENNKAICTSDEGQGCMGIESLKYLPFLEKGMIACNIVSKDDCTENPPMYKKIANDGNLACSPVIEWLKTIHPLNGEICEISPYISNNKHPLGIKFCGKHIITELNKYETLAVYVEKEYGSADSFDDPLWGTGSFRYAKGEYSNTGAFSTNGSTPPKYMSEKDCNIGEVDDNCYLVGIYKRIKSTDVSPSSTFYVKFSCP